jgi:hypothetical protein
MYCFMRRTSPSISPVATETLHFSMNAAYRSTGTDSLSFSDSEAARTFIPAS